MSNLLTEDHLLRTICGEDHSLRGTTPAFVPDCSRAVDCLQAPEPGRRRLFCDFQASEPGRRHFALDSQASEPGCRRFLL